MKNQKMRALSLIAFLFTAGFLTARETAVDLYLQPDTDSKKIDQVELDDPRLGQPAPVMDEARAALGWHFADFSDRITGYVRDAKIGKDLLPVENAIIYSAPSTESPVLGVFQIGDSIEILDTGEWWTLEVEKDFPVYFVLDTPPPLPPVTGTAAEEEPLVELEPEQPGELSPVIEETPAVDVGPAPRREAARPLREAEQTPPPQVIGQSYEGVFMRSKRFLGLFKPTAPFYLEAADGSRIAWVDTSGIVVPGTLKEYLDKQVIVHGEREFLPSSKDWIIRARNMRLK